MNNSASLIESQSIEKGEQALSNPLSGMPTLKLIGFVTLGLLFVILALFYFANLMRWSEGPELGWSIFFHKGQGELAGQTELAQVYGEAKKAGLTKGDFIIAVNGAEVRTHKGFYLNLNMAIPGQNTYTIIRNGKNLDVSVPNRQLGTILAFQRFGITYLVGVIFFIMGVVVWVMKPGTGASWAFFVGIVNTALLIAFFFTSKLTPEWLNSVYVYAYAFIPASIIHLALTFPVKRLLEYRKAIVLGSYLLSLQLFFVMEGYSTHYADLAKPWQITLEAYLALSFAIFLGSILLAYLRPPDAVTSARARIILIGTSAASILPLVNVLSMRFADWAIIPHPALNSIFYVFFPLAIAYSIVRHNLFDADVYIKRAIGYVIMTALVAITYFFIQTTLTQFVLEPLLGARASGGYPILFALLVVFIFNPLNAKVQHLVDRLFYRSQFDYKEMVLAIGNALSSVMNLPEIVNRIIGTVRQDMFIESASLIVMSQDKEGYLPLFTGIGQPGKASNLASDQHLSPSDPIVHLMEQERKLVTRYDLVEDPRYREMDRSYRQRFQELDATLALPLISHDQLVGILLVGNKKSGKFYTREEIDLLRTLANEGAIALQNANLLEENVQKGRMDEELKIARDIQMSMLPDQPPEIKGFSIAAKSFPAREVGGDFYDFIELSGDEHNQVAIIVGDVSGKAVSGALVMAASRSVLRVLAETHQSAEAIMNFSNVRLCSDVRKGMFVALVYAIADSTNRTLTLANAGQTQPIRCPAQDGAPPAYIETEGDCFPLGIIPDCQYQEAQIVLQSGDTIAFYTDGIVEASNAQDELYGFERLLTTLGEARHLDADAVLNRILDDVNAHVGEAEQHDDITLVILKVA